MASQIKNIVQFTGLVLGVPTSLPHRLNIQDLALVPDFAVPSEGAFTITADATNVTVTRLGSPDSVDVLVEWYHTENRVFGPAATTSLIPRPFVVNPGPASGFDPGRTIIVAKSGGATASITAGNALAAALVPPPSATDPAIVWVFPGVYAEPPLVCSPFISIIAVNGSDATFIDATVATSPIITGAGDAELDGFTVRGADGVGGAGLLHNTAALFIARNCVVQDCTTAYLASGAGVNFTLLNALAQRGIGETMNFAYRAELGATMRLINAQAIGVPAVSLIGVGFCADGAGSDLFSQVITAVGCTDGVRTDGTGEISVVSGVVQFCTNGLRIAASSGTMRADNVRVTDSTTWDLLIEAATAVFSGNANTLRNDRLSIDPGASILSQHASEFPGEPSIQVLGEFSVGNENNPTESSFGGGDGHVRNMSVFQNTNLEVGVWTDITTEMSSASGSTADAFPGVVAGNAMYIGGAVAFPNDRIIVTAAIVLGAGSLIWEFSNGAGWTAMDVMTSDAFTPFDQYAQDVFGRINIEQLRFGPMAGWASQVVNGVDKFWVRVRVGVGITTSPTLEQIKLGTNRTEINDDGTVEFFGAAEIDRAVTWHQRLMDALGGAAPTNGALLLSANVTITPIDNRFANNAVDGLGGLFEIPPGLDTSQPMRIEINWIPKGTGGDVEFETNFAEIKLGSVLNGAIADTNVATVQTAPAVDVLIHNELEFSIPNLVPGDLLSFSLFRDATGGNPDDTLAASIDLVTVALHGIFWR